MEVTDDEAEQNSHRDPKTNNRKGVSSNLQRGAIRKILRRMPRVNRGASCRPSSPLECGRPCTRAFVRPCFNVPNGGCHDNLVVSSSMKQRPYLEQLHRRRPFGPVRLGVRAHVLEIPSSMRRPCEGRSTDLEPQKQGSLWGIFRPSGKNPRCPPRSQRNQTENPQSNPACPVQSRRPTVGAAQPHAKSHDSRRR